MFIASAFITFFLLWLGIHFPAIYYPFLVLAYLMLSGIFWYIFSRHKAYFFIHWFLGLLLGMGWVWYLDGHYPPEMKLQPNEISIPARVEMISSSSLIAYDKSRGRRFRLTGVRPAEFFPGDTIHARCMPYEWENNPQTEKLMRISYYCHNRNTQRIQKSFFLLPFMEKINQYFFERISRSGSGLLPSFLASDTETMDPFYIQRFRNMGIAHLFSASGLHLGLIFGFFFLPFRWARRESIGSLVGFSASFLFLMVLGVRVSLLRAFIFLSVFLALKLAGRRTPVWYVLAFSAFIIEAIFPASSFSISFLLSFGVTATILWLFPVYTSIFTGYPKWLRDHLGLTFAAFSGSVVLSHIFFDYIHVSHFFWNLMIVPVGSVYLFLSILTIHIPFMDNVINLLDQFFYFSAQLNFLYLERNFGYVPEWFARAFILSFWIFVLLAFWKTHRKRVWFLRHHFWKIIAGFFGIFTIASFLFSNVFRPKESWKFHALPYEVIIEDYPNLYIIGEKSAFIQDKVNIMKKINREVAYYKKAYIMDNLTSGEYIGGIWNDSRFSVVEKYPQPEMKNNPIFVSAGVFLFHDSAIILEGRLDPVKWKPFLLDNVKKIYLIRSKAGRDAYREEEWQEFFSLFGFSGKIYLSRYFHWTQVNDAGES